MNKREITKVIFHIEDSRTGLSTFYDGTSLMVDFPLSDYFQISKSRYFLIKILIFY